MPCNLNKKSLAKAWGEMKKAETGFIPGIPLNRQPSHVQGKVAENIAAYNAQNKGMKKSIQSDKDRDRQGKNTAGGFFGVRSDKDQAAYSRRKATQEQMVSKASREDKIKGLIQSGEAKDRKDAIAQLEDMGESAMKKGIGLGDVPTSQKLSIDKKLNSYDPKMAKAKLTKSALAKAWKMKKGEYEKERIVEDHKVAQHEKFIQHGEAPTGKIAQHALAPTDYAMVEAKFLKAGTYHEKGGMECKYPWDVIDKYKGTYKGREFYIGHPNEQAGLEYGTIDDVYAKNIDGENWLVAKVKIPETDFTGELLTNQKRSVI